MFVLQCAVAIVIAVVPGLNDLLPIMAGYITIHGMNMFEIPSYLGNALSVQTKIIGCVRFTDCNSFILQSQSCVGVSPPADYDKYQ